MQGSAFNFNKHETLRMKLCFKSRLYRAHVTICTWSTLTDCTPHYNRTRALLMLISCVRPWCFYDPWFDQAYVLTMQDNTECNMANILYCYFDHI